MTPPNIKPVPNLPGYRWNVDAGQYIDARGRFVSRDVIRNELGLVFDDLSKLAASLSEKLLARTISLAEWQTEMMVIIKNTHLVGTAMSAGGWYQISDAQFGLAGAKIRQEYGYLNAFASSIEDGTTPFNGHIKRISRLYGQKGRTTYYESTRKKLKSEGFTMEASRTTPADHCASCLAQEARGFQPIGELIPIGERTCRSNCKCYLVFKNPTTGEERST